MGEKSRRGKEISSKNIAFLWIAIVICYFVSLWLISASSQPRESSLVVLGPRVSTVNAFPQIRLVSWSWIGIVVVGSVFAYVTKRISLSSFLLILFLTDTVDFGTIMFTWSMKSLFSNIG